MLRISYSGFMVFPYSRLAFFQPWLPNPRLRLTNARLVTGLVDAWLRFKDTLLIVFSQSGFVSFYLVLVFLYLWVVVYIRGWISHLRLLLVLFHNGSYSIGLTHLFVVLFLVDFFRGFFFFFFNLFFLLLLFLLHLALAWQRLPISLLYHFLFNRLMKFDYVVILYFYVQNVNITIFSIWLESLNFIVRLFQQVAEVYFIEVFAKIFKSHEKESIVSHLIWRLQPRQLCTRL